MSDEAEEDALSQEVEEEGIVVKARQDGSGEDELDDGNDSSELTASENDESWITWFVNLRGHDYFCEIDEEYIQDDFNLQGLTSMVPYYDYALDLMLDVEIPSDTLSDDQQEIVESAAIILYGLIHARFILTTRGMQRMLEKFQNHHFGRCPRVYCNGQAVLPVGLSDSPRNYTVNVFCPKCHEIFHPRSAKQGNLDGAYFGSTFAHLFLLSHPDLIPPKSQQTYVPRIYGFRINKEAAYYRQRNERAEAKGTKAVKSAADA